VNSVLAPMYQYAHSHSSRVGRIFYLRLSASVCFPYDITKPMQLGSPNLTKMLHDEFWKPIYVGVKRLKVEVKIHKTLPA